MSMRRIIALDLGKFKTVACVMNAVDRSHVFAATVGGDGQRAS